jgi:hypothetical protein
MNDALLAIREDDHRWLPLSEGAKQRLLRVRSIRGNENGPFRVATGTSPKCIAEALEGQVRSLASLSSI